jgi:TolA-binding protein
MQLDDKIYNKVIKLCKDGDKFLKKKEYDNAIKKYNEGLELIPSPKNEWEASTWIYSALGDSYYIKEDYQKAKNYFYDAFNCPDAATNPFILIRLGECLYECEEFEKAKRIFIKSIYA